MDRAEHAVNWRNYWVCCWSFNMTIKSINDEIRKVEQKLNWSPSSEINKAKLQTLKEVRDLIESKKKLILIKCTKETSDDLYFSTNFAKEILGEAE